MSDFKLNENQQKAVNYKGGDLLIIAGAGTGKTAVLTQRIISLIKNEFAKPSEILALTFTEKAAQEMQERVDIERRRVQYWVGWRIHFDEWGSVIYFSKKASLRTSSQHVKTKR